MLPLGSWQKWQAAAPRGILVARCEAAGPFQVQPVAQLSTACSDVCVCMQVHAQLATNQLTHTHT